MNSSQSERKQRRRTGSSSKNSSFSAEESGQMVWHHCLNCGLFGNVELPFVQDYGRPSSNADSTLHRSEWILSLLFFCFLNCFSFVCIWCVVMTIPLKLNYLSWCSSSLTAASARFGQVHVESWKFERVLTTCCLAAGTLDSRVSSP